MAFSSKFPMTNFVNELHCVKVQIEIAGRSRERGESEVVIGNVFELYVRNYTRIFLA